VWFVHNGDDMLIMYSSLVAAAINTVKSGNMVSASMIWSLRFSIVVNRSSKVNRLIKIELICALEENCVVMFLDMEYCIWDGCVVTSSCKSCSR
jgi:hypothetical protein